MTGLGKQNALMHSVHQVSNVIRMKNNIMKPWHPLHVEFLYTKKSLEIVSVLMELQINVKTVTWLYILICR